MTVNSSVENYDIAFVVISGGLNYNIQTFYSTVRCNNSTAQEAPVVCICNGSCTISIPEPGEEVNDPYSSSPPLDPDRNEPYDDLVEWVSLYELRQSRCGGRPPLRIITSSLPEAYQNQYYEAEIRAEGGVPSYNWTEPRPEELPDNLTRNCYSLTCTISGRVNDCAGTYTFNATINDIEGNNATRTYSLVGGRRNFV